MEKLAKKAWFQRGLCLNGNPLCQSTSLFPKRWYSMMQTQKHSQQVLQLDHLMNEHKWDDVSWRLFKQPQVYQHPKIFAFLIQKLSEMDSTEFQDADRASVISLLSRLKKPLGSFSKPLSSQVYCAWFGNLLKLVDSSSEHVKVVNSFYRHVSRISQVDPNDFLTGIVLPLVRSYNQSEQVPMTGIRMVCLHLVTLLDKCNQPDSLTELTYQLDLLVIRLCACQLSDKAVQTLLSVVKVYYRLPPHYVMKGSHPIPSQGLATLSKSELGRRSMALCLAQVAGTSEAQNALTVYLLHSLFLDLEKQPSLLNSYLESPHLPYLLILAVASDVPDILKLAFRAVLLYGNWTLIVSYMEKLSHSPFPVENVVTCAESTLRFKNLLISDSATQMIKNRPGLVHLLQSVVQQVKKSGALQQEWNDISLVIKSFNDNTAESQVALNPTSIISILSHDKLASHRSFNKLADVLNQTDSSDPVSLDQLWAHIKASEKLCFSSQDYIDTLTLFFTGNRWDLVEKWLGHCQMRPEMRYHLAIALSDSSISYLFKDDAQSKQFYLLVRKYSMQMEWMTLLGRIEYHVGQARTNQTHASCFKFWFYTLLTHPWQDLVRSDEPLIPPKTLVFYVSQLIDLYPHDYETSCILSILYSSTVHGPRWAIPSDYLLTCMLKYCVLNADLDKARRLWWLWVDKRPSLAGFPGDVKLDFDALVPCLHTISCFIQVVVEARDRELFVAIMNKLWPGLLAGGDAFEFCNHVLSSCLFHGETSIPEASKTLVPDAVLMNILLKGLLLLNEPTGAMHMLKVWTQRGSIKLGAHFIGNMIEYLGRQGQLMQMMKLLSLVEKNDQSTGLVDLSTSSLTHVQIDNVLLSSFISGMAYFIKQRGMENGLMAIQSKTKWPYTTTIPTEQAKKMSAFQLFHLNTVSYICHLLHKAPLLEKRVDMHTVASAMNCLLLLQDYGRVIQVWEDVKKNRDRFVDESHADNVIVTLFLRGISGLSSGRWKIKMHQGEMSLVDTLLEQAHDDHFNTTAYCLQECLQFMHRVSLDEVSWNAMAICFRSYGATHLLVEKILLPTLRKWNDELNAAITSRQSLLLLNNTISKLQASTVEQILGEVADTQLSSALIKELLVTDELLKAGYGMLHKNPSVWFPHGTGEGLDANLLSLLASKSK